LAQALDLPIAAVSSLKALACNAMYSDMLVCPLMDARRNQVYSGIFRWQGTDLVELAKEDAYDFDELLLLLKKKDCPVLFLGQDVFKFNEKIEEVLADRGVIAMPQANFPRAASVAGLAVKKIEENEMENAFTLRPVYLRQAEAERQYQERIGEK